VDFAGACRFGDEIEVRLSDFQLGKTSLAYRFEATVESRKVFSGKMTKCHIAPATGRAVEISGEILESLKRKI
jgi:acyl-CoA thioesterase FadM